jgi:hypothetical protein
VFQFRAQVGNAFRRILHTFKNSRLQGLTFGN